jgi:acetyl esterase/lipase
MGRIKKIMASLLTASLLFMCAACNNVERDGNSSKIERSGTVFTEREETEIIESPAFTPESTVGEVLTDPAFGKFGRLLFPVDRTVSENMTLADVSSSNVYVWYNNIRPDKTVEIINHLKNRAADGEPIFYSIYSEEEIAANPSKTNTGLFYFGGENGKPYAIMNAGGGFSYVGAMHDSFPHALEASKHGYNSFALIYRPNDPYSDLAKAIEYINDYAEELGVDAEHYSLWGGSAGARMAATLGNADYLYQLTERRDIHRADAVIMQYTGYNDYSKEDAPTYVCVGTNDGIASWRTMQARLENLDSFGIPTEFHAYDGLPHGFGLGTDTIAEGWFDAAIAFWEKQTL